VSEVGSEAMKDSKTRAGQHKRAVKLSC